MKDTIQKAIEISDAKIQFVSLVDKAANKRQFLITKADEGQAQFSTVGKILKTDADTHYVTGIVYEPLTEDAHGNFMTEDEIRKAAYWFAKNGDKVDLQHSFEQADGLSVVENYVAPSDMEIDGTPIVKGTWLMTVEVQNEDVWSKVQKGEVTGFSMGGMGRYSETETDLTDTVEKQGLLKRLAGFLGVDVITKGAVKDQYDKRRKSSDFWTAFNTLQDVLCKYGYQGEIFETDDTVIREALTDFVQIITDVMAEPNVLKAIAVAAPVEKAGRKISSKNRDTLQAIYESLGAFLAEFDEDSPKEEKEVTKQEIEEIVEKSIAKALAKASEKKANDEDEEDEKEDKETTEEANATDDEEDEKDKEKTVKKSEAITSENINAMVQAAVEKAMKPQQEAVTAAEVQSMIEKAVKQAVDPVLKSRGLPSNLNSNGATVEKAEEHYLHGIL